MSIGDLYPSSVVSSAPNVSWPCLKAALKELAENSGKDVLYVFLDALDALVEILQAELVDKMAITSSVQALMGAETKEELVVHQAISKAVAMLTDSMSLLPLANFRACQPINDLMSGVTDEVDKLAGVVQIFNSLTDRNNIAQLLDSTAQNAEQEFIDWLRGLISWMRVQVQTLWVQTP